MTRARLLLPVLLAGLAGLVASSPALPGEPPEDPGHSAAPGGRASAVAVLHDWDRARAAAWRAGEPDALAALYTRGSAAGRADRRLLAAYTRRGLRVRGMRMQVADVVVEAAVPGRLRLLVTDRLVGAVAVGRRTTLALPRDRWTRRHVVMVRTAGRWRVASVRGHPRSASTASTSRSANS